MEGIHNRLVRADIENFHRPRPLEKTSGERAGRGNCSGARLLRLAQETTQSATVQRPNLFARAGKLGPICCVRERARVVYAGVFVAEGSAAWLARVVIAKIAGTPIPAPRDLPEGRGGHFNEAPETYLTLAQFAEQDSGTWLFVDADTPECAAWCGFLKIETRPIAIATTTMEFNGRKYSDWPIKKYGLRVPRLLPPQQKPFDARAEEQRVQGSSKQSAIGRAEAKEQ
jgi:hypothetical protein